MAEAANMKQRHFSPRLSLLAGLLSLICAVTTAWALSGKIIEFAVPTANSGPFGITAGPDGNIWFTEAGFTFLGGVTGGGNKIGRITTAGSTTEFSIPTAGSFPVGITAGPDGNLWFIEASTGNIGRITTTGVVTEFPTTFTGFEGSFPFGTITAGSDGALWFVLSNGNVHNNNIGRITTAGAFTEFPVPTANSEPVGITAGPDGNLWFIEFNSNKIGRFSPTPSHKLSEFPVPTADSEPLGITRGPDGNIWFTENAGNKIGQLH
jgi:streptogramin lyase